MRVGIVGGRLQGLEAVYLSREAGFETVLFDKDKDAPAGFLADQFHCLDLLAPGIPDERLFAGLDVIIPAAENRELLLWLHTLTHRGTVTAVALDLASFATTASKVRSNQLFREVGVSFPRPWPECGFPVVVKPAAGSGSEGVRQANDHRELQQARDSIPGEAVVQEFLSGPSYSLEIIADHGTCCCLQVTQLEVDRHFDCKRVIAGPTTGRDAETEFAALGEEISAALGLSGIMDVEVIQSAGQLYVLEIDARLPSQTPSAVYHSTGLNMVSLLAAYWSSGTLPYSSWTPPVVRGVVYEHYRFHDAVLEVVGEHVLRDATHLQCYSGRFSAERFIANFEARPESWVGTAIYVGTDEDQAWEARERGVQEILKVFGAQEILDPTPEIPKGTASDQTHP